MQVWNNMRVTNIDRIFFFFYHKYFVAVMTVHLICLVHYNEILYPNTFILLNI